MTDPTAEQVVLFSSSTASSAYPFVTTAAIPVGRTIYIATNRSNGTGQTNGLVSITTSAGAVTAHIGATGARASTTDVNLWAATVTTQIPAGATVTANATNTSATRRVGIMAVMNDVTSSVAQTFSSQATGGDGATSTGANGTGTGPAVTASAANTTNDILAVAAFSTGATTTFSIGSGYTLVDEIHTNVGTADRGVAMGYKVLRGQSGQTASATGSYSASASWSAALATYPITVAAVGGKVIVGGVKKTVANRWVVVGGVKKSVVGTSVIVGGVKKSVL